MNELENSYGDEVEFLYLNANEEGEAAFKAGNFRGHPAVVLLTPDGTEQWRAHGVVSYGDIDAQIVEVLNADRE